MKKEDLLICCREAIKTEEIATTVYLKHLSAIVLRSGYRETAIQKIKETLEYLIAENTQHKKTIMYLVERITGEDIDVY